MEGNMPTTVIGPDQREYQFPDGTTKETAVRYFKSKGIGVAKAPGVGSISAYKPDLAQKLADWRQQLSEFANRGAGSYKVGNTSAIADFMASAPMGALRMAKGGVEAGKGKVWQGTKDLAGGALEAGTIPSLLFAPEGTAAAKRLLPSTEKAGKLLEAVEQVAGHVPVDLTEPTKAATEILKNAKSGGSRPKVIADWFRRINDPNQPPMTFADARRFYQNAINKFAPDIQGNVLKGKPRYMLAQFAKSLDRAIQGAAEQVGKGQEYAKAMKAYHNASTFESVAKSAGKKAKQGVGLAAAGAAGAMGAKAGYDLMTKK